MNWVTPADSHCIDHTQEKFNLEGWDWEDDVLPAFKALEDDPDGAELAPELHGVGGPIPIYRNPYDAWGAVATAMR